MARHFTTVPAARRCERHAIPDFHSCLSRRLSSGRGADGAPRCGRNRQLLTMWVGDGEHRERIIGSAARTVSFRLSTCRPGTPSTITGCSEADIKKMLENGLMLSPKPDGRINQKGAGRVTLCVKCNNATGRWYGTPYITVAKQAMELLIDLAAMSRWPIHTARTRSGS